VLLGSAGRVADAVSRAACAGLRANGQTQRWVYWELRMRAAKPFIGTTVRGYAELWRAVAADANVPEPFDHAQGARPA